ncbi:MAG TPA: HAD-IA family hydrolase [Actinomycetota bacterium]|nr:HAD-IA family hydrolase [Actinomycetota bacterium]
MTGRRFDAVVFDLFGTLVPEFRRDEFFATVDAIALRLGADVDRFREAWTRSAPARQTGGWSSIETGVRQLCRDVGLAAPDDDAIAQALVSRAELYARKFRPRPGAVETLHELKARGYPIALVSMCAPDTPAMWHASPMAAYVDVAVFSSERGLRKPDAAIYLAAARGLGVAPERCLYCGDGAYGELSGAEAVGMTAVLIRDPELPVEDALRPDAEDWPGTAIDDLRDLVRLAA